MKRTREYPLRDPAKMMEKQLVFPCGAFFPIFKPESDPARWGEHTEKDGGYKICVYYSGGGADQPWRDEKHRAPCLIACPTRKRRHKQRVFLGETGDKLGYVVDCVGRVWEGGKDVTKPRNGDCGHCLERSAYITACKKAARAGLPLPDLRDFGDKWREENGK